MLDLRVSTLFSQLPKKVMRRHDPGISVPATELTGGMDAGEAFAALGHQIGVTRAVHF